MPVRKIPRNYRHITGRISQAGQDTAAAFEGGLERDFYVLMDFDPSVIKVEHQPVYVPYRRLDGSQGPYRPDALIQYLPELALSPRLCEVKTREELKLKWAEYRPRLKAAIHYARERGWRFKIYTEKEIRTPYLDNVYLLREYRFIAVDELKKQRLLKPIQDGRETTLQKLINTVCPVVTERGPWWSLIWHLIAVGQIEADLFSVLDFKSVVRLPQGT